MKVPQRLLSRVAEQKHLAHAPFWQHIEVLVPTVLAQHQTLSILIVFEMHLGSEPGSYTCTAGQ